MGNQTAEGEAFSGGASNHRLDERLRTMNRLVHLLDRWQPPAAAVLIGTAVLVGLGTGLGAVAFIWLLRMLRQFFTLTGEWLQAAAGPAGLVLVPMLGALIAGPLITFFTTTGGKEVRAWTLRQGSPALEAAGKVHTDMQRGFIRAEVVSYQDLMAAGSVAAAREKGLLRLEGREYVVQDGDVIHFRFSPP